MAAIVGDATWPVPPLPTGSLDLGVDPGVDPRANLDLGPNPGAHRDPGLRAWLEFQSQKGLVALVRYSEGDAFLLVPPNRNATRRFVEMKTKVTASGTEHSYADKQRTLARIQLQGERRAKNPGDRPHNEEGRQHAEIETGGE